MDCALQPGDRVCNKRTGAVGTVAAVEDGWVHVWLDDPDGGTPDRYRSWPHDDTEWEPGFHGSTKEGT